MWDDWGGMGGQKGALISVSHVTRRTSCWVALERLGKQRQT